MWNVLKSVRSVLQADACHAYQIFHAHGVPDEHIVVMMYDDIAHNEAYVPLHETHNG